jgi:hypothetical protein
MCEDILYRVIGYVDILPFDLTEWYCQYQRPDSDTEIYWSPWRVPKFIIGLNASFQEFMHVRVNGADAITNRINFWVHEMKLTIFIEDLP